MALNSTDPKDCRHHRMIVEYQGMIFPVPFDPDFRVIDETTATHIDELDEPALSAFIEAARHCEAINSI